MSTKPIPSFIRLELPLRGPEGGCRVVVRERMDPADGWPGPHLGYELQIGGRNLVLMPGELERLARSLLTVKREGRLGE